MEIFIDGGLFELTIAASFGYAINFIFKRKYLLIAFSLFVILTPALLFFFTSGELYYWLISFCFVNSVLLIALLWKERSKNTKMDLFDFRKMKEVILKKNRS